MVLEETEEAAEAAKAGVSEDVAEGVGSARAAREGLRRRVFVLTAEALDRISGGFPVFRQGVQIAARS